MAVKGFWGDRKNQRIEMMVMSDMDEIRHRERVRPQVLVCSKMKRDKRVAGKLGSDE